MRRFGLFVAVAAFVACASGSTKTTDTGTTANDAVVDTQPSDNGQIKDIPATDQGSETENGLKPPPITWVWGYKSTKDDYNWTGKVDGTEEINGKKYYVASLGTTKDGKFIGVKTWWDVDSKPLKQLGFKRVEINDGNETDGNFGFAYDCDPPLFGDIVTKPGPEITITQDCNFEYVNNGKVDKNPIKVKVIYQLMATDETVTVPYGNIDGVWHYKFSFIEATEAPIKGDLWVKPLLGIVKMSDVPGWYFGVELTKIEK